MSELHRDYLQPYPKLIVEKWFDTIKNRVIEKREDELTPKEQDMVRNCLWLPMFKCDNCNKEDYDLATCIKCGNWFCSNCQITFMRDGFCKNCFKKELKQTTLF